ncbi:MAG: alpha/beta fold hydrolase [Bacteroidia bacterium]
MAVKLFHKLYPNTNSKEHLIILHGLFGMLDNWHNMAQKLSEYVNVVSVDQRNHGHSPHVDDMSFELMAQDLHELLEDLNIEKVSIMGHSMGGKTAMVFAHLYPQMIHRLIVVDIAPKTYKPGHTLYFEAFKNIDFSIFDRRSEADMAFAEIEPNSRIRQFLLKNLQRSEKGYKLKFNLPPIESFYPDMIAALKFEWPMNIPCLFLNGGRSQYVLEEDKDDIISYFPLVEFVCIEDAGHWVHAEKPVEFFEAVKDFLQE